MLNQLSDIFSNIERGLTFAIFFSPVFVASGYLLHHIYDVCFNVTSLSEAEILNIQKNEIIFTIKSNFSHILNMNQTQFLVNIHNIEENQEFFEQIKKLVALYKNEDYNFFLGQMRGNFRSIHLELLKKLDSGISLKGFLKEKYAETLLQIISLKINKF